MITAGLYLRAIAQVFLGETNDNWSSTNMPDLNYRELLALAPLLIMTIAIGVAPAWVLDVIHKTTLTLPFGAM